MFFSKKNKKKSILVCIPFFYDQDRLKYLFEVINNFLVHYIDYNVKIIIDTNNSLLINDTNQYFSKEKIKCISIFKNNLKNNYHLTWLHRNHFYNNIKKYDYFIYIEDDILLPYHAFKNYIDKLSYLWPEYIPNFIRLENDGRRYYCVDFPEKQIINLCNIKKINHKMFYQLDYPYNGFWLLPQKNLLSVIDKNFKKIIEYTTGYSMVRENAASFPLLSLKKIPLIEVDESLHVTEDCFVYHLTNNYIYNDHQNGKIPLDELIVINT